MYALKEIEIATFFQVNFHSDTGTPLGTAERLIKKSRVNHYKYIEFCILCIPKNLNESSPHTKANDVKRGLLLRNISFNRCDGLDSSTGADPNRFTPAHVNRSGFQIIF